MPDPQALSGRGVATVTLPREAIQPGPQLLVDLLEDSRVEIETLHDRESRSADVLERPLGRRLAAGGVFPKLAHDLLEALVGSPLLLGELPPLPGGLTALLVGAPAVGPHFDAHVAHLDPHVAELFQDQADARLEIALARTAVRHRHNLSPRESPFNVPLRIQCRAARR